jgi:Ca2+-binding EF-hand superfamily protein
MAAKSARLCGAAQRRATGGEKHRKFSGCGDTPAGGCVEQPEPETDPPQTFQTERQTPMKTTTKIAVAFVALAGIAGAAVAAQADSRRADGPAGATQQAYGMHHGSGHHGMRHGERRHGGGHAFRLLESFDANDDGKLSQEEIDQTRGERFGTFDADADKALTLQEYEQLWLDAMRERMVDRFQALDADGDAKVTAEEFQRPFSKMVRRMDRNEDGVIDRGDFQRHQPRMPMQGGPAPDDNG